MTRRDHKKTLVVDSGVGFTGGLNISDDYAAQGARRPRLARHPRPPRRPGGARARVLLPAHVATGPGRRLRRAPLRRRRPPPRSRRCTSSRATASGADARSATCTAPRSTGAKERIFITNAYFLPTIRLLMQPRPRREARRRRADHGRRHHRRDRRPLRVARALSRDPARAGRAHVRVEGTRPPRQDGGHRPPLVHRRLVEPRLPVAAPEPRGQRHHRATSASPPRSSTCSRTTCCTAKRSRRTPGKRRVGRGIAPRRGGCSCSATGCRATLHSDVLRCRAMTEFRRFRGTDRYLTNDALEAAVNCALALERPLLVKGEPGTGKTLLAEAIAEALGAELITWHVKSTTRAQDGLYVYDTVQRLYDSRFGDGDVQDIRRYIKLGPLGRAFTAEQRVVLLIDEVDKADLEFPNDLLHELDRMRFRVIETGDEIVAKERPVVIITSNNEKELPDAFLRRCVFHFIDFPEPEFMRRIVARAPPRRSTSALVDQALQRLLRDPRHARACASARRTSELIDWIAVLKRAGVAEVKLDKRAARSSARCSRRSRTWWRSPISSRAAGGTGRRRHVRRLPLRAARAQGARSARRRRSPSRRRSRAGLHDARSTASTTWRARCCVHSRGAPRRLRRGVRSRTSGRRTSRPRRSPRSCSTGSRTRSTMRELTRGGARRDRGARSRRAACACFEERLKEQKERHDGGNRWIGTGGTSPFGTRRRATRRASRSGRGGGGKRRRVKTADARKYQPYRSDLVLDVRQIEVALRKLRAFAREGARRRARHRRDDRRDREERRRARGRHAPAAPAEHARHPDDGRRRLDGSVRRSSMSQLFSAAKRATHWKELRTYYFHNCVYGRVYKTEGFQEPVRVTRSARRVRQALQARARRRRLHGALRAARRARATATRARSPALAWLMRAARALRARGVAEPRRRRRVSAPDGRRDRQRLPDVPAHARGPACRWAS